jgi:uncharacterized protein YgbK (DUF1537 family)
MTYYETAGYENGTEIKQRLIEESVRNLPSVREKIETLVAQQMGLVDEENQEAAGQEIAQRQAAMQPQIPGMNGMAGGMAGGMGGGMGGAPTPQGGAPADLNTPLTPDTFTPERIDLAR